MKYSSKLTPIHIDSKEKSYLPVERLRDALKDNNIHNIALTGPFGSGKSSVIRTLVDEENDNYHFLEISLATLDVKKGVKRNNNEEILSKRIELGILQQLVYREKDSTLPYSRFRRIHFFEKDDEVSRYVIMTLLAVFCYAIAFEPTWLRIDSIYEMFDFGNWNLFFDLAALLYLIVFFWTLLEWAFKKYWGSKLSKLNLSDGEIEVKESGSIFNEHLEEIMYFFQATKYDVVVLEDLDRFDNSAVFLKLRELNYLLNHSDVTKKRKIVFVYAVKDDLFKDTSRTKFFDYIVPVIPIMNMSNASDLLKNELQKIGYTDINDEDMEDIAGFIDDMRILHNIANEYQQYREQLMGESGNLNATKLLASIVYKNYFPDEFALLHHQEGRIADFISKKKDYIEYVRKMQLSKEREIAQNAHEVKVANAHLKMKELRTLYIYAYRMAINDIEFDKFVIDGKRYDDNVIIDSEELFENLISGDIVYYVKRRYTTVYSQTIKFEEIEKRVSNTSFKARRAAIMDEIGELDTLMYEIQKKDDELNTYTIKKLMMQFPIGEIDIFKNLKFKPMEELFLMRGYIAEDYYDYISYFYSGMITESDRQLLLEMKLGRKPNYNRRIDKIDNFMQKLPSYVYTTDSILNLDVVDWLARHHEDRKLVLIVNCIRTSQSGISFLVAFNRERWQYRDVVNKIYMHRYADMAWVNLSQCDIAENKNVLLAMWFRWVASKDIGEIQRTWLNENYGFVSRHIKDIGLTKAVEVLADSKVDTLDNYSAELLDSAITLSNYIINTNNLLVIYNFKTGNNTNAKNLTYSKLKEIKSPEFDSYMNENLNDVVKSLMATSSEPFVTQTEIVNNKSIDDIICLDYVGKQTLMIEDINEVVVEDRIKPLYKVDSVLQTWENVYFYINKFGGEPIIYEYIQRNVYVLISKKMELKDEERNMLFNNLILSNGIRFNEYEKLVKFFEQSVDGRHITFLDAVEQKRLELLLHKGRMSYCEELRDWLYDKPLYSEYMLWHREKLIKDYQQVEYNQELAMKILESNQLKLGQKLMIIPYFNDNVISSSVMLANKICHMIKKRILNLSHAQILAVIKYCNVEVDRVCYATTIIQNNPKDQKLLNDILNALGGNFKLLTENGNPKFDRNDYNVQIISVLENIGLISSKKEMPDAIRVYSKNML